MSCANQPPFKSPKTAILKGFFFLTMHLKKGPSGRRVTTKVSSVGVGFVSYAELLDKRLEDN